MSTILKATVPVVDPARMSDLRPAPAAPVSSAVAIAPGVRALTADEVAHLDRARAHLRSSGVDVTDPAAVGALLHRARTGWAAAPKPTAPPQALIVALGVGVGDLVVARAAGARWALHHGSDGPAPAVVSASGEDAALPLTDVRARWISGCTPEWVGEYVASAAAHLWAGVAVEVPTPRSSPDNAPRTPADLPHPPSPAVQDIALGALEHALEAVLERAEPPVAAGGTPQPFALLDASSGPEVRVFDGDPAQAQQAARAWVRSCGAARAARAAVAWYGWLPGSDTGDQPAVLVEASDVGRPSLVVAHRYSPATPAGEGRPRPARALGEPVILGQGNALL